MLFYIKRGAVAGRVTVTADGKFVYYPYSCGRRPSRKGWPSPESALKGRVSGGRLIEVSTRQEAVRIAREDHDSPTSEIAMAEETL